MLRRALALRKLGQRQHAMRKLRGVVWVMRLNLAILRKRRAANLVRACVRDGIVNVQSDPYLVPI